MRNEKLSMKKRNKRTLIEMYLYIMGRKSLFKINKILYILGLKGMGITNYQDKLTGEENFLKKLKKENEKINTAFDVGANIGEYSLMINKFFPDSKIFAFEPIMKTYNYLKKNVPKNVIPHNLGLGKSNKTCEIFYGKGKKDSTTASLFKGVEEKLLKKEILSEIVKINTLDYFCKKKKIKKIDFLKIDVEGNELNVLKGAKNLLKNKKIKYIQFEFNEMNLISKSTFRDFVKILKDYELYRLLPKSRIKLRESNNLETEIYLYQNIVAILKNGK